MSWWAARDDPHKWSRVSILPADICTSENRSRMVSNSKQFRKGVQSSGLWGVCGGGSESCVMSKPFSSQILPMQLFNTSVRRNKVNRQRTCQFLMVVLHNIQGSLMGKFFSIFSIIEHVDIEIMGCMQVCLQTSKRLERAMAACKSTGNPMCGVCSPCGMHCKSLYWMKNGYLNFKTVRGTIG